MRYSEAVREFQSVFILTVLREHKANQFKAAQKLGVHRNTLRSIIRKLEVDIRLLRPARRRPPLSELTSLSGEEGHSEVNGMADNCGSSILCPFALDTEPSAFVMTEGIKAAFSTGRLGA
jgi:hypothetical protein